MISFGRPTSIGCCSNCSVCPNRSIGTTASFSTARGESSQNRRKPLVCATYAPKAQRQPTSAAWSACLDCGPRIPRVTRGARPWHGDVGQGQGIMAPKSRAQRTKRPPKRRATGVAVRKGRKRAAVAAVPGMVEAALAAFAHEVRTPLTGILAISDLLATSDLGERERRWVDTIKAGAEHLASLATLFVDAARSRGPAAGMRQDLFDLRVLARSIGDSLAGRAAAKGLQSQVDISEKLPALVVGDPVRLRAALENLIDNAVKFTQQGGVALTVKPMRGPKGKVGVAFSISDSGI